MRRHARRLIEGFRHSSVVTSQMTSAKEEETRGERGGAIWKPLPGNSNNNNNNNNNDNNHGGHDRLNVFQTLTNQPPWPQRKSPQRTERGDGHHGGNGAAPVESPWPRVNAQAAAAVAYT